MRNTVQLSKNNLSSVQMESGIVIFITPTTEETFLKDTCHRCRHPHRKTSYLPGGKGVLPYKGYIGMCSPKEYGFSAVLVINRVSILADFGHFGPWFLHSSLDMVIWVCF